MKFKLIGSILVCNIVGVIGALVTNPRSDWFVELNKPWFNPPGWIFGPVWTMLYTLMGISIYLIWKDGFFTPERRTARAIFIFQLVLNSGWSYVFFGMREIGMALVLIICIWLAIVATIIAFYRVHKLAACLFIPYLLWVTFASILNFSLWRLNPWLNA